MTECISPENIAATVGKIVDETPVLDIHTHLYDAQFGDLLLWGIDELLTYHYLVAEVYRVAPLPYDQFWALSKKEQADHIWKHLFIERSPPVRGVPRGSEHPSIPWVGHQIPRSRLLPRVFRLQRNRGAYRHGLRTGQHQDRGDDQRSFRPPRTTHLGGRSYAGCPFQSGAANRPSSQRLGNRLPAAQGLGILRFRVPP